MNSILKFPKYNFMTYSSKRNNYFNNYSNSQSLNLKIVHNFSGNKIMDLVE